MAVIRVNHSTDYTVMSNYHLRDMSLPLRAKGLLSQMLSLPPDWDYSVAGLSKINQESESVIVAILKELKEAGYLTITKKLPNETESGRIEYIYDIYETPKQDPQKQGVEKQGLVFRGQLSKEIQSKDNKCSGVSGDELIVQHNNIIENQNKKIYGSAHNIPLTDEEYEEIKSKCPKCDYYLDKISEYKAQGKTYPVLSTILKWYEEDKAAGKWSNPLSAPPSYDLSGYTQKALMHRPVYKKKGE